MVKILDTETVDIEVPMPHPENPNVGNVDLIAESLEAHDQYVPITVDVNSSYILRGNHTWKAAVKLGWEKIRVQWVDATTDEARRILVADNRLGELAERDADALAAVLASIEDPVGIGYTTDELDAVLAGIDGDTDKTHSTGELIDALDVTLDEPRIQVEAGEVWEVGPHVLFCVEVFTGWPVWSEELADPESQLFAPYPGPFAPLSKNADKWSMVLVQPDPYIASHIVTMYADTHGDDQVSKR